MKQSLLVLQNICMFYIATLSMAAHSVPFQGHQMLAAGPSPAMIEATQWIIKEGGNVVDAAVASALTLAVTSPYYASLGGGGFAIIKIGNSVEALDFREVAPAATDPQFLSEKSGRSSTRGGSSIAIPGLPAGLFALHKKYGKLPWKKLFKTALSYAQEGFSVSGEWVKLTSLEKENFNKSGRKYFFKPDGSTYLPGETLKQIALAQALLEFRNRGEKGFYHGAIAQDLIKTSKDHGGTLTAEDFKNYKVRWLNPMVTEFAGHKIYMMPPPSSAGVVLKTAFALTESLQLEKLKPFSNEELHLMTSILQRAFRSRSLLGDPDFTKINTDSLTSSAVIQELASSFKKDKATVIPPLKEGPASTNESQQTTHFSIMDKDGHAVSMTVTLNGNYGSRVVSDHFGIALNNQMDDFTTQPGTANQFGLIQGAANSIQPGKRPLSSMSPTLVEKNGKTTHVLGSPGGPRIISSVYQTLYRHLYQSLDIDEAIQAGRVHHQFLPHKVYVENKKWSPEHIESLQAKGHLVEVGDALGRVNMIQLHSDGTLSAAFDSRGEGAAGGR